MAYASVSCHVALLAVFATAALGKIRSRMAWSGFVRSVRDLRMLPDHAVPASAALVAGAELTVVALLAVPGTAVAGLLLAALLLTVFTASIRLALRRNLPATCRCFGSRATPLGRRHLVRNGLLLVAAGLGLAYRAPAPHPAGLVVAVAAGLAAAAVLILLDEIVDLFAGSAAGARPLEKGRA